jgi:hypothetical protein
MNIGQSVANRPPRESGDSKVPATGENPIAPRDELAQNPKKPNDRTF